MAALENFTLYNYWNLGLGEMPAPLRYIHEHNRHMAASHGYPILLLTAKNISAHVQVPDIFYSLSPVHQSDVARFLVLHETGGIWLDSDAIVVGDLAAAFSAFLESRFEVLLDAELDTSHYVHTVDREVVLLQHARIRRTRLVGTVKIGSSSLFFRGRSVCSQFCREYVLEAIRRPGKLEWPELGPDNVTALYRRHPDRVHLNPPEVTREGCHFFNWVDRRSRLDERWLKDTSGAALARAVEVAANARYVLTWNLHDEFPVGDRAIANIFAEPRSVFCHLVALARRGVEPVRQGGKRG